MGTIALSELAIGLEKNGASLEVSDGRMWESVKNFLRDITELTSNNFYKSEINVIVAVTEVKNKSKYLYYGLKMSDEMQEILRRSGSKQFLLLLLRMSNNTSSLKPQDSQVKQEESEENQNILIDQDNVTETFAENIEKGRKKKGRKRANQTETIEEKKREEKRLIEKEENVDTNERELKDSNEKQSNVNNLKLSPRKKEASIERINSYRKKIKKKVFTPFGKTVQIKIRKTSSIRKFRWTLIKPRLGFRRRKTH